MDSDTKKQLLISIVGVVALIIVVIGISYAFFYYTSTSDDNSIQTGNITFATEYTEFTDMSNYFPATDVTDSNNVATATIKLSGSTTYEQGIEYTVFADGYINKFSVPVTIEVTGPAEVGILTKNTSLDTNVIATGKIAPNTTLSENAVITIKAYVDGSKVLITDNKKEQLPASLQDRVLVTPAEWDDMILQFNLRVVATQGGSTIDKTERPTYTG